MLHIVDRRTEIEDIDAIQPPRGNGWSATERATLGVPPGLRRLPAISVPRFMEHGVVGSEPKDVDAVGTMVIVRPHGRTSHVWTNAPAVSNPTFFLCALKVHSLTSSQMRGIA